MEISQYEVVVNEKNGTCGFVINLNFYKLEEFLGSNLQYEVFPKDKKVKVFNETQEIYFINLTDELIYYSFKTIKLLVLGGTEENGGQIKIIGEAILV